MLPTELEVPLNELNIAVSNYRDAKVAGDQPTIDSALSEYQSKYATYTQTVRQLKQQNPDMTDVDFFSDNVALKDDVIQRVRGKLGHLNDIKTRYIVMEVIGNWDGMKSNICELELYAGGTMVPYEPLAEPIFNLSGNDESSWNRTDGYVDKYRLNDGIKSYSNTTTAVLNRGDYSGDPNVTTRVVMDLGISDILIDGITMWAGNTNGSDLGYGVPRMVNFYGLKSLDDASESAMLDSDNTFEGLIGSIIVEESSLVGGAVMTLHADIK